MGITWCRERLEQAQNSKNPVDRILIRCSNALKPKTYSRSQDRLADDIVYKGVRKDNLQVAPPRSRTRLKDVNDWHSCVLMVPDDPTVAPIPPPRKKRKRKMNGDVNESHESLSEEKKEKPSEVIDSCGEKRPNRFVKQSESKRMQGDKEEKSKRRERKMRVVKNISTVSLPNYNELTKPSRKVIADDVDERNGNVDKGARPPPRRNQSTVSLPGEGTKPKLSSLSETTIHRLETYMKRCRSFGSLKPQQLLEKLEEFHKTNRSESESSDSWSGLDDWDMGIIEYCDPETANLPPLTPKSTLPPRNKIFSVGSPEETPRPQSPVSEEEEETIEERSKIEMGEMFESESVPSDWFCDSQKNEKLTIEKEKTKTPPPSPTDVPEDSDSMEESQPTLNEILTKNEEEELSDLGSIRRESSNTLAEEEVSEKPTVNDRKFVRNRSQSLIETNPNLLGIEITRRLSNSETTTRLIDELTRNSEIIEKELLKNPEQILNRLRRASLYENLPEDPFEIYLRRKKPSLRESLSVFLGFQQDQGIKTDNTEEKPPPLPVNPPPINTTEMNVSLPLVTITTEEDPPKSLSSIS